MELNYKRLYRGSGKVKESRCVVFTSSIKREIWYFRVVVLQWQQRNVQKSVMHPKLFCQSKACFKRRATAVPHSIDRIWQGSGATFEIIQFRNLNLVRQGNWIRQGPPCYTAVARLVFKSVVLLPCGTQFTDYEKKYMCKCFDSNAPDCDAFFILNLARLN